MTTVALPPVPGEHRFPDCGGYREAAASESHPHPRETQLRHLLKRRLADWDEEMAKSPRIVVRSPIDRTVIAPDDLAFKQVNAGDELLKVADLNDLRLKVKLSGDTVADARVGQKAMIKAIAPDYKEGVTFRAIPSRRAAASGRRSG